MSVSLSLWFSWVKFWANLGILGKSGHPGHSGQIWANLDRFAQILPDLPKMPRLGQNVQNAQICPELPRMPNVPKMPRFAQHAQNCPKCPELPKMPRSAQNAKNYTDWHRIAQILPNLTRCAQNTQNCPEVPKMHRFAQNWYFYISASKTQITQKFWVNSEFLSSLEALLPESVPSRGLWSPWGLSPFVFQPKLGPLSLFRLFIVKECKVIAAHRPFHIQGDFFNWPPPPKNHKF